MDNKPNTSPSKDGNKRPKGSIWIALIVTAILVIGLVSFFG